MRSDVCHHDSVTMHAETLRLVFIVRPPGPIVFVCIRFKVEYTRTKDGWLKDWQPGWVGIVHDADPTVTIPVMSYDIAAELAHFGKKVRARPVADVNNAVILFWLVERQLQCAHVKQ